MFKFRLLQTIIICCLGLFPWSGFAQELSLQDAILLALRYNPNVQNAEIQRVIDKFNLRLAKNSYELQYALQGNTNYIASTVAGKHSTQNSYALTPSVNYLMPLGTNLSFTVNNPITHNDGGNGAHYNPSIALAVTQPLLRGAGTDVTLAPLYTAYDKEKLARLTLKNTAISTITDVISAYTALVGASNTLAAQKIALEASQVKVNQQQQLVKAGRVAPADVIQFQADAANQRLAIEGLKNAYDQSKLGLITVLGLDPNSQIEVPVKVSLPVLPLPDLKQSIAIALQNNTTYQALLINYRITQRELLLQQDQQKWQLDLVMNSSTGGGSGGGSNAGIASLSNGKNKSSSIGLQLSIPIHDLQRQSGLVQAKAALEQQKVNLDAGRRKVESDVRNAYDTVLSQKVQIQQAQQALKLAEDNLRIANYKLSFGKITPFEVSSLQTALTNAQISLIASEIGYDNALATFDSVLGVTLERWNIHIRY